MDTYNSLLEGGWRMSEIDSMDMLGFLGIRAWNARKEKKKKEETTYEKIIISSSRRYDGSIYAGRMRLQGGSSG